jgi:hypothetical protein
MFSDGFFKAGLILYFNIVEASNITFLTAQTTPVAKRHGCDLQDKPPFSANHLIGDGDLLKSRLPLVRRILLRIISPIPDDLTDISI